MAEQVEEHEKQYHGRTEAYVPEELFKDFKKKGIPCDYAYSGNPDGTKQPVTFFENQFVTIHADQSAKKTHLARVEGDNLKKLDYRKTKPYGISPRNIGQYFLQEALMQPAEKAPLVIVKGVAGTSKTFYSLAVGLEKLLNHPTGEYRRILICRPNVQFDSDIGFLPGDEQEKISPLMRPIMDNLEQLIDSNEEERYKDELELQGKITRAGRGTKLILLGDSNQIDRPFLDERTNGLSYASEHMKGSPLCWQITMDMEECERSELALDACKRL